MSRIEDTYQNGDGNSVLSIERGGGAELTVLGDGSPKIDLVRRTTFVIGSWWETGCHTNAAHLWLSALAATLVSCAYFPFTAVIFGEIQFYRRSWALKAIAKRVYNLARTCKGFKNAALDALWSSFTIESANLMLILSYSEMGTIHLTYSSMEVRQLYKHDWELSVFAYDLVLHPQLTGIGIRCNLDARGHTLIKAISQACPQLRKLAVVDRLKLDNANQHPELIVVIIERLLCLQSLKCVSLNTSALHHISHLPFLTALSLNYEWEGDMAMALSTARTLKLRFLALRRLTLHVEHLRDAVTFMRCILTFPVKSTTRVNSVPTTSVNDLKDLFNLVDEHAAVKLEHVPLPSPLTDTDLE
ncbi:hypothetical protein CONPUDRAFT_71330 [Coniophora puteana RWD-64-598 SS2]|uniref:F-box domain-containing protein n=1 Tax=Coniophora puteana (strain RWD-64-598) TaxID=741705 RepID=A0A5M3MVD7_CONPW|nr:uncharacterized protein CONPUDRAFT_71330 [Coniophora puteana RWD-64-598 SS2]EIW82551.1 hypothetical protein CONPUDRAFT_71330 [Coniophora puteana RWD-64-598 SS2]